MSTQSNASMISGPTRRPVSSTSCTWRETVSTPNGHGLGGERDVPLGLTLWKDHSASIVARSSLTQPVVCDTSAASSKLPRTSLFIGVSLKVSAAPLDDAAAGCFTALLEAIA